MKRAKFITIEGLEGSGKTSAIDFIKNFFRDKKVTFVVFREPGTTQTGEQIREILLNKKSCELSAHTELLLYLAARTQLIEEKLEASLKRYDFVVCDRFFDSTLVYQGVGLGLKEITQKAVKLFSLGVKPDLTFILDVDPVVGLKRIKDKDRIESRPLKFHRNLRNGYIKLAKKEPSRIKLVDATGSLDKIYSQIKKILNKKFNF